VLIASLFALTGNASAAVVVKQLRFLEVNTSTVVVLDTSVTPQNVAIDDHPGKPMTVSFQGSATGKMLPRNHAFKWPNLSGVYVDQPKGRVQIFIKRNVLGTVTVRTEKNRLVITIPHAVSKVTERQNVADGVQFKQIVKHTGHGPVRINVLEVDPHNPGVEIMPALAAHQMGHKSNVSTIVTNHQAVAGINGSFFKPDVGTPLGILIINQELVSGPIFDRVALGITPSDGLAMSQIRLGGEIILPDKRSIRVQNINQPRVQAGATVIYSSRWGAMAPKVPGHGMQVQLRNGHVTAVSDDQPLPIPKDGFVISGPGTAEMLALGALTPNQPVNLNVYTIPDWSGMKHAIGGGPWLVRNGKPYIDLHAQHFNSKSLGYREPRSAVGITADGKLLLVTVDGRQKNVSVGMTLSELSFLMQKLGAVNAMNLDGGSSTQMSIYGKTVNRPSSGNVGVSNSLIIRKSNGDNVAVQAP
jgi:exopolysaccharide biosynthesis protein